MAPRKDATAVPSASQTQQDASSDGIEDFEISKMLITQLAKSAIPKGAELGDDTTTALVKGSTVFINYLTATAQDIAASRAHKSISGADVLKALELLEFGELVPAFQGELEAFRQVNKGKTKVLTDPKGKGKEKLSPASPLKPAAVHSAADGSRSIPGIHVTEVERVKNVNGGAIPLEDVEMRDVREDKPPLDVKPVLLPIE